MLAAGVLCSRKLALKLVWASSKSSRQAYKFRFQQSCSRYNTEDIFLYLQLCIVINAEPLSKGWHFGSDNNVHGQIIFDTKISEHFVDMKTYELHAFLY